MLKTRAQLGASMLCLALAACEGATLETPTANGARVGGAGAGGPTTFAAGGSAASRGGAGPVSTVERPTTSVGGGGGMTSGTTGAGGGWTGSAEPCRGVVEAQAEPSSKHCYVDRTPPGGASYAKASATCDELVPGWSHLVTIGSDAEQGFVTSRLLTDAKDGADAWIGLTCPEATHPSFLDCYCKGGCKSPFERSLALASWAWTDAAQTNFLAWAGPSPDGAGRAAALTWSGTWGWVDRDEKAIAYDGPSGARTHRVICEIE